MVDFLFEGVAELDGGDIVVYFAAEGVGDGASFFGDDDADDVELLGDADSTAVSEPEVGVDVYSRGDGEYAASGEDLVAFNDNGAVVEGRVFEEEGFEEGCGDAGVDDLACADEFFDFVAALEDDEGAGLALRHVHAGLDVGLEVGAGVLVDIAAPELEAFGEGVARELGLGADEEEEFAYFGLEHDDKGDESDAHDAAEDLAAETHVEHVEDAPGYVEDEHGPEDAYDVGAFEEAVEFIDEEGYHEDVEDVDKSYFRKGEHGVFFLIEN